MQKPLTIFKWDFFLISGILATYYRLVWVLSHKKLLICLVLGGEVYFQLIPRLVAFCVLLYPLHPPINKTNWNVSLNGVICACACAHTHTHLIDIYLYFHILDSHMFSVRKVCFWGDQLFLKHVEQGSVKIIFFLWGMGSSILELNLLGNLMMMEEITGISWSHVGSSSVFSDLSTKSFLRLNIMIVFLLLVGSWE